MIFSSSLVSGRYLSADRTLLTFQTEAGRLVVLNSGIEFAATYFVMLLALFFLGGGCYFSADFWIARRWRSHA